MTFKFVDLFAGIGGFHAVGSALGGRLVYASEIDTRAAQIYAENWGLEPRGNIENDANDKVMRVPLHDLLFAGFPCQPFSKSGHQRGMEEVRGTLFWSIAKIIEKRRPSLVVLENVRNLVGPRHKHEWHVITTTIRDLGYRISDDPTIISPHQLPPAYGGKPQVRERVFIGATRIPKGKPDEKSAVPPVRVTALEQDWDPNHWNLRRDLPLESTTMRHIEVFGLTVEEFSWLEAWQEFIDVLRPQIPGGRLPGFPIWSDSFVDRENLKIPRNTPEWKKIFLTKNSDFYTAHKDLIDKWNKKWKVNSKFPPSRRKFEWQGQSAESIWECLVQFRPSGIRVKPNSYVPALVAMNQTSILGSNLRRITPREAARLQGFPDWFSFDDQPMSDTYRQLGNAVNVSVAYQFTKALVERDRDLLQRKPKLVNAILGAPVMPVVPPASNYSEGWTTPEWVDDF
ncbi:MAG: DNA (cytosine-5-)-methyltransferase [Candidatus Nanopelagicaceae bacterium]